MPPPGPAGPAGVPRPLTSLVGRDNELARLHALLDDPACRLVTLVGPGGIGKTRLAVEVLATRQDRHHGDTAFVPLAGTGPGAGATGVVTDVARALGVPLLSPRDPVDLIVEHLAGRDMLLVLDNLEHLPQAAGVISGLLRRAPALTVLVTSRRPLGLGPEWLVEVPGLPYPPPWADDDAGGYAAVQLFTDRARLLRPDLPTVPADGGAARICRLVAGVPLAIELAARWVRSASPALIADRLAAGTGLLETSSPDIEYRHRSMSSVIGSSCDLLTDDELRSLRRLSMMRNGFDLGAAVAVADAELPVLAGLVDHSLVAVDGQDRYTMHELVRQDAAARLAADPAEEAATRQRHAEHYAALLTGGPRPPDSLDHEADNLRAATEWLVEHAAPDVLDAHLVEVWALHRRAGRFREAQAFLATALDRDDVPPLLRARWHRMLGEAHQAIGEAPAARHHLEQASQELGHRAPASPARWAAVMASEAGRRPWRAARSGATTARSPEAREAAAERCAAAFAVNEVYWTQDDRLPMLPTIFRALNDAERSGDPDLLTRARAGLGMILGTVGLHRRADRHLTAAAAGMARSDDPVTICWVAVLDNLYRTSTADWAAVESNVAAVTDLRRRLPLHRLGDQALLVGAGARYLSSRYASAAEVAQASMMSGRDRRDPFVQFWGAAILVETSLRVTPGTGAPSELLEDMVPLLGAMPPVDVARFHAATARAHLATGHPARARESARAAGRLLDGTETFEPYGLEAHAGVVEVGLALREAGDGHDPDRTAAALRRLRRYANAFPFARPRALTCVGLSAWAGGRPRAARRAWARAVHEAEALAMPYELGRAHLELGRHLPAGAERAAHLAAAGAAFTTAGCPADLRQARELATQ